jgi:hypothetical protein
MPAWMPLEATLLRRESSKSPLPRFGWEDGSEVGAAKPLVCGCTWLLKGAGGAEGLSGVNGETPGPVGEWAEFR